MGRLRAVRKMEKSGEMVLLSAADPLNLVGIVTPEARVPAGHLWKGVPIELEAEYIMARKIGPALEAAGLGFEHVVKVQAYVSDSGDIPAVNEVWNRYLAGSHAVRTFVPTARPGFAIVDAHIEINVMALCPPQRPQPATIPSSVAKPAPHRAP